MINAALALRKVVKLLKTLRGFVGLGWGWGFFWGGASLVFCFALFLVIQLQVLEDKLCRQELCVPMSKGWTDLCPKVCEAALRTPLTCLTSALWQVRTPKAVGWDTGLIGQ